MKLISTRKYTRSYEQGAEEQLISCIEQIKAKREEMAEWIYNLLGNAGVYSELIDAIKDTYRNEADQIIALIEEVK